MTKAGCPDDDLQRRGIAGSLTVMPPAGPSISSACESARRHEMWQSATAVTFRFRVGGAISLFRRF
ncbi:hypothetical protein EJ02DRAFT_449169 [Clathrospora elynae]|uniref:Uncharacterized protein n=1 Tax=Clathrospora elynae TaxID=706981 RepID=A0A6A5T531_9PLEO|nr:hypothetical protein EJ02DRAFT_449169 [Clathrospora elynae]